MTFSRAELKAWRQLSDRAGRIAHRRYLMEGEHLCAEAVAEGSALAVLCQTDRQDRFAPLLRPELPLHLLSPRDFAQISDTRTPQGIAALCALPENAALSALGDRVVCLNGVQDPGNVGTILRTMDAAGFTGLLMDLESADAFSPKALRASMGAVLRVPVRVSEDLAADLTALPGHHIVAGLLDGSPFYERPAQRGPLCLVIGNEGAGIAPDIARLATQRLRLPMPGKAESLNAAVAASIMIYDYVREWEGHFD